MKTLFWVTITLFLLPVMVSAGNLIIPLYFDSAKVLPKGVRNLRYNYLMVGANDKFDSTGAVVGVGDAMNMDISYQQFVDGQNTALECGVLEGYLKRQGRDMSMAAGKTTGQVNVDVDAQVPILAWGITPSWTLAAVLPIVTVRTHVDVGFVAYPDLQTLANKLVHEGKAFKATDVQKKTVSAIPNKGKKYGYDPLPPSLSHRKETSLGDVRVVNKIQLLKRTNYILTLQNEWMLPTGKRADLNRIVDVPTGDGQFDFGLGLIGEYTVNGRASLWTRLGYTWQIPDKVAKRVPESALSSLSPDVDGQVSRDLGDSLYLSLGGSFDFYQGIKLKTQYSFQHKQRDRYRGSQFPSFRYGFLGKDSEQSLHVLQVGLNYSTISLFQEKKFPIPLDFNLISGMPFAGRNVTKDSSVVAEVAIFF